MRITINQTVLATDAAPTRVRNFRLESAREVQEGKFLRAVAASFFDRANAQTRVSFEVVRTHPSGREAEAFLLGHGSDVPASGLAVFTAVGDSGQAITRYLNAAVVEAIEGSGAGTSTRHLYVLRGGALQTLPPSG
ncbi:MAG: hypothetical protein AAGK14_01620 [Verrucomicrobiota bacterium]